MCACFRFTVMLLRFQRNRKHISTDECASLIPCHARNLCWRAKNQIQKDYRRPHDLNCKQVIFFILTGNLAVQIPSLWRTVLQPQKLDALQHHSSRRAVEDTIHYVARTWNGSRPTYYIPSLALLRRGVRQFLKHCEINRPSRWRPCACFHSRNHATDITTWENTADLLIMLNMREHDEKMCVPGYGAQTSIVYIYTYKAALFPRWTKLRLAFSPHTSGIWKSQSSTQYNQVQIHTASTRSTSRLVTHVEYKPQI